MLVGGMIAGEMALSPLVVLAMVAGAVLIAALIIVYGRDIVDPARAWLHTRDEPQTAPTDFPGNPGNHNRTH